MMMSKESELTPHAAHLHMLHWLDLLGCGCS